MQPVRKAGSGMDRRKEPRWPAPDPVELSVADPLPRKVLGRLLDISRSGFCAAHGDVALHSGMDVHFRHAHGEGRARVVWVRIQGGNVESGFLVQ